MIPQKEDGYKLKIEKVSKSFFGVQALHAVDLYVKHGEVHALMGENGAGKSTLMKILTGIYQKDEGSVFINGVLTNITDPKTALDAGISMIHQELNPVMNMTVAENIFLGKEPCYGRTGIINKKKLHELASSLLKETGISIDPNARVGDLSIAEIQMIEIVKAVSYNAGIIIMDEPTSAITSREVVKLFEMIQSLKAKGVSIIYISHKLDEIFEIADTITVLRDGQYIDTKPAKDFTAASLIKIMVGRDITGLFAKETSHMGEVAFEVSGFSKNGIFENASFKVHKGEIVGFAGLLGAGRTELMETIFGLTRRNSGQIKINDKEVNIDTPRDAVKNGLALITDDRKLKGLNLKGSVKTNVTLSNLHNYCKAGQIIMHKKESQVADQQIRSLTIKTLGRNQLVGTLSGGNQQKVVLSNWFLTNPQILILDEPTRGIDIGAKQEIYNIIHQLAQQGKAIILISSEMPELLGLCDRIIVMHNGNITGSFDKGEFNPELIVRAAMNQHFQKAG
ncbi:MAG: sugar ABC transporter ATP-binding protein [Chitinophagaceae bacterium]